MLDISLANASPCLLLWEHQEPHTDFPPRSPLFQKWPASPSEKLREKSALKISRSPLRFTHKKVWQQRVGENRGHTVWGHLSGDKKPWPVETETKSPFPHLWAIIFLPHLTLYMSLLDHKGNEAVSVQSLRQKGSKQPKEKYLWMVSPSRQGQENLAFWLVIWPVQPNWLVSHSSQPSPTRTPDWM